MSYRELIWLLCLRIALDLFDTVEMLEVVLEENIVHHNISKELKVVLEEIIVHHNIPGSFENAIITLFCVHQSYSLSSAVNANKAVTSWGLAISRGYINLS